MKEEMMSGGREETHVKKLPSVYNPVVMREVDKKSFREWWNRANTEIEVVKEENSILSKWLFSLFVNVFLPSLKDKERKIVEGFVCGRSLRDIGSEVGMSYEGVRKSQIILIEIYKDLIDDRQKLDPRIADIYSKARG